GNTLSFAAGYHRRRFHGVLRRHDTLARYFGPPSVNCGDRPADGPHTGAACHEILKESRHVRFRSTGTRCAARLLWQGGESRMGPLTSAAAGYRRAPSPADRLRAGASNLAGGRGTAMDMMNPSRLPRHTRAGYRFASAFAFGLALIITGAP